MICFCKNNKFKLGAKEFILGFYICLFFTTNVGHSEDCKPLEPYPNTKVSTELNAKLEAEGKMLLRIIKGGGRFDIQYKKSIENLSQKIEMNERLNNRFIYLLCTMMNSDSELSARKKMEMIEQLHKLIFPRRSGSYSDNIVTVRGEYCYRYGDRETPSEAKQIAFMMAKARAVGNYRQYIKEDVDIVNGVLFEVFIKSAIEGTIHNVEVVRESEDNRRICVEIKALVNSKEIDKLVSNYINNKSVKSKKSMKYNQDNDRLRVKFNSNSNNLISEFCALFSGEEICTNVSVMKNKYVSYKKYGKPRKDNIEESERKKEIRNKNIGVNHKSTDDISLIKEFCELFPSEWVCLELKQRI